MHIIFGLTIIKKYLLDHYYLIKLLNLAHPYFDQHRGLAILVTRMSNPSPSNHAFRTGVFLAIFKQIKSRTADGTPLASVGEATLGRRNRA
jgi:hypothetical protein